MPTIAELKDALKAKGIKGYSGKNKAELEAMLAGGKKEAAPAAEAPKPKAVEAAPAPLSAHAESMAKKAKPAKTGAISTPLSALSAGPAKKSLAEEKAELEKEILEFEGKIKKYEDKKKKAEERIKEIDESSKAKEEPKAHIGKEEAHVAEFLEPDEYVVKDPKIIEYLNKHSTSNQAVLILQGDKPFDERDIKLYRKIYSIKGKFNKEEDEAKIREHMPYGVSKHSGPNKRLFIYYTKSDHTLSRSNHSWYY